MTKYYVDFGTGAGNKGFDSLKEAMEYAEENCSYTQESIKILEDGEQRAVLPWYGVKAEEDDEVIVNFGDFGFYGSWWD